ncbi:PDGLE domain-containing protein [Cellulomonas sp. DKR-3]|uniref:PDGLE domain-containing protein n=1 Tax=Cellulomonas fulva TaxID=2835530 RepID=A0ABS5TVI9_9CELL|nr:energy-coupling factor ABC transporter permease [Cellulomonas fulva]MBT0993118.1 PDGLE domain-containing protein [Cellulomonas fulva]
MHVPDHVIDPGTSIATAVVAGAVLTQAVRHARAEATRERLVLAAATSGFVFAAQMVNYPVASGTSGHLIGAALAAALVGPWLGFLAVTAVLAVQAVLFADGGITALGVNVLLMAGVGTLVGWGGARLVERLAHRVPPGARAALAAAGGALLSVPAAALAFVVLYAIGGTAGVGIGELAGAMVPVHGVIGLGEALVTGAVVALVAALAPGLAVLDRREAGGAAARSGTLALGVAAVVTAGGLSALAVGTPDGLEWAAQRVGFDHTFGAALLETPFADYGQVASIPGGVAGLVGVAAVVALVGVLALTSRRPSPTAA